MDQSKKSRDRLECAWYTACLCSGHSYSLCRTKKKRKGKKKRPLPLVKLFVFPHLFGKLHKKRIELDDIDLEEDRQERE
jgi:hypothetical protein